MLVSSSATMLRAVAPRLGAASQPALLRISAAAASHSRQASTLTPTAPSTLPALRSPFAVGLRPAVASSSPIIMATVARRAASGAAAPPPAGEEGGNGNNGKPMDWNTFFTLRKQRRRLQLVFSTVACLGGGTLGAIFLGTGSLESLVSQLPLDPFIALGVLTFGFAALGWLLGPILGTTVFNMIKRSTKKEMTQKEVQFFARVKKNRVDPSSASASNPVPDFYGEKIQSVAGYRRWLKDQRAFRKKRTTFIS